MVGESEVKKLLSNVVIKQKTYKETIAKKCNHKDTKLYHKDSIDNNK